MRGKTALVAVVVAASAALPSAAGPPKPAEKAAAWIAAQQQSDGGFFDAAKPADAVADAVTALVAGSGSRSPIDRALGYLSAHAWENASKQGAYAGRIVMALVAAGRDPRSFGGHDFVARLKAFYDPVTGFYDTTSAQFSNSLAALGILAAGERLPPEALRAIRLSRCPDGGFSFDPGCSKALGSDVDTTSLVLCVLAEAGVPASDGVRADARAFLLAAVNAHGGYGFYADKDTNANSTGLALAAIAALGENPEASPWRTPGGDPRTAVLALQTSSGGFRYDATRTRPDELATVQATPGVAGSALPVRPRAAVLPARRTNAAASPTLGRAVAALPATAVRTPSPAAAANEETPAGHARTTAASAAPTRESSRAIPLGGAILALAFACLRLRAVAGRSRA